MYINELLFLHFTKEKTKKEQKFKKEEKKKQQQKHVKTGGFRKTKGKAG